MRLVLDNSVVAAWVLTERDAYADAVLDAIGEHELVAPAIWPLELANVLAVAERRGRITAAESSRLRDLVTALDIAIAPGSTARVFGDVLTLAREESLSAYDASYLDLAIQLAAPLATSDERLRAAAVRRGVAVFGG